MREAGEERRGLNKVMSHLLKQELKMKLKKIFWMKIRYNYFITAMTESNKVEPGVNCKFIPITMNNCHRVGEFREESRISEYREKLAHNEIGYFAENNGKIIGSQWATINKTDLPCNVRDFTKLRPNEGVIHDAVVSEKFRGMRIGPFMVSRMNTFLFKEYGLQRITWDVNINNHASLRMLEKLGFRKDRKVLYVAAFGKLLLKLKLKKYTR
jgi:ribosomal protein S18 acetylase RimI-like enzyme